MLGSTQILMDVETAEAIDTLRTDIRRVEKTLAGRIGGVESSLTGRIDSVETSLTDRIDSVETFADRTGSTVSRVRCTDAEMTSTLRRR